MLALTVFKKTKGTGFAYNKALKTTPFGRSDAFTRGGFAIMPHVNAPLSLMLYDSRKDTFVRAFLLFIGWSSVIGSFGDGGLGIYALWLAMSSDFVSFGISLDEFLKSYVEIIYWVKSVAFVVMPKDFATWLFSVPALAYFPTRIVMSAVIGWWALKKASVLKERDRNRITIS